jgi:hypothetical protein
MSGSEWFALYILKYGPRRCLWDAAIPDADNIRGAASKEEAAEMSAFIHSIPLVDSHEFKALYERKLGGHVNPK